MVTSSLDHRFRAVQTVQSNTETFSCWTKLINKKKGTKMPQRTWISWVLTKITALFFGQSLLWFYAEVSMEYINPIVAWYLMLMKLTSDKDTYMDRSSFLCVRWSHIFREANSCADALVNYGHSLGWDNHVFNKVPYFLS